LSFWKEYPNKREKPKAFAHWKKKGCENGLFEEVMRSLKKQKQSEAWLKEGGRYIPMASTWVGNSRWEDELDNQNDEW